MLQALFNTLMTLVQVVALAVTVVEIASEVDGTKGAEKKAAAIAKAKELLPPEKLGFFGQFYDQIAGLLIDAIVAYANAKGFFRKSA